MNNWNEVIANIQEAEADHRWEMALLAYRKTYLGSFLLENEDLHSSVMVAGRIRRGEWLIPVPKISRYSVNNHAPFMTTDGDVFYPNAGHITGPENNIYAPSPCGIHNHTRYVSWRGGNMHRWDKRRCRRGLTYFAFDLNGNVKVGLTSNFDTLQSRIESISVQYGTFFQVRYTVESACGVGFEKTAHTVLSKWRIDTPRGIELFNPPEDVLGKLLRLKTFACRPAVVAASHP